MNVPSRARRALVGLKWILIVGAVLVIVNVVVTAWIGHANQKRIDDFFQTVGASSMRQLAGTPQGAEEIVGNSWYLYLGAVASLSTDTVSAYGQREDEAKLARPRRSARRGKSSSIWPTT